MEHPQLIKADDTYFLEIVPGGFVPVVLPFPPDDLGPSVVFDFIRENTGPGPRPLVCAVRWIRLKYNSIDVVRTF